MGKRKQSEEFELPTPGNTDEPGPAIAEQPAGEGPPRPTVREVLEAVVAWRAFGTGERYPYLKPRDCEDFLGVDGDLVRAAGKAGHFFESRCLPDHAEYEVSVAALEDWLTGEKIDFSINEAVEEFVRAVQRKAALLQRHAAELADASAAATAAYRSVLGTREAIAEARRREWANDQHLAQQQQAANQRTAPWQKRADARRAREAQTN